MLVQLAALASGAAVVVVRRAGESALASETAVRIKAELSAAGFEVHVRDAAPGAEPRAALEDAAKETSAFAAIMVFPARDGAAEDIWVVDRWTNKTVIRTASVDGPSAPADLAVRAVELLKASLLEAETPPKRKESGSVPPSAPLPRGALRRPAIEPKPAMFERFALAAGLGILESTGGIGPAPCPIVRVSYGARGGLTGRLGFVGPCVAPDLRGPLGSAGVRQEMAALEVLYAFKTPVSALVPVVSLGAGGYHLRAFGSPVPPYVGISAEVWALLAMAGIGTGFRFNERASLLVEGHAILTAPRPVVTLAGAPLGTAGRPSVLANAAILVRF